MPLPDVVGNSLSRARQRLEEAGIEIAALHPVRPPQGWKPPAPHNFETEPYVVGMHTDATGSRAVIDIVVAWKPGKQGSTPATPPEKRRAGKKRIPAPKR